MPPTVDPAPLAGELCGHLNVEHRAGGHGNDQHDQHAAGAGLEQLIEQLAPIDPAAQGGGHGLASDQQAGAQAFDRAGRVHPAA